MKKKIATVGFAFLLLLAGISVVGVSGATVDEYIEINEDDEAYFEVEIIDHPDEVELGDEIEIEYYIGNTGNIPGEQEISISIEAEVAGQEIWSESESENVVLDPNRNKTDTYSVDTGDIGEEYDIGLFEVEIDVNFSVETEDDQDEATITLILPGEIPGFTFMLLLVGIFFAVVIYHTKKREFN